MREQAGYLRVEAGPAFAAALIGPYHRQDVAPLLARGAICLVALLWRRPGILVIAAAGSVAHAPVPIPLLQRALPAMCPIRTWGWQVLPQCGGALLPGHACTGHRPL